MNELGGEFDTLSCITSSRNDSLRSIKFFSVHLKKIVKAEEMDQLTDPSVCLPKRQYTSIVGTLTSKVREWDRKYVLTYQSAGKVPRY